MGAPVSIHLADVGLGRGLRLLMRGARAGSIDGLRHADVGAAAELSGSLRPNPKLGRIGLIGFWDDEEALDRFVREHPLADRLGGGWHARLEPLRRFGSWPGLDEDIAEARRTEYSGPAVVLTLGRLRPSQGLRFLRASAKAEAAAISAPGAIWATALARPPMVATCSLWESTRALATYAYGTRDPGHPGALAADTAQPFHKRSAFVRFRPYHVEGELAGPNPLLACALTAQGPASRTRDRDDHATA